MYFLCFPRNAKMTIHLGPDLEQALADEARRIGTTPDLLANECLRERFVHNGGQPVEGDTSKNLAEYLANHIGVLHSSENVPGGARMSEDTGKKFTSILLEQRERGRL
jgi:hypothetical protein